MIRKKQQWIREKRDKMKKHERSLFLRVLFYFLLVLFFVVSVYVFFFSGFLKVNNIFLDGTKTLSQEDVVSKISGGFDGNYLGIIPKNNYIFILKSGIERKIFESFKKIKKVEVKKTFPDSLHIIVYEREALLVWVVGEDKFVIDEDGRAYEKADFDSKLIAENNLIEIEDKSRRAVSIGEKILDKDYISFSLAAKGNIEKECGLDLENRYRTNSRIADEATLRTSEGWDIYLSSKLELDYSSRMLKTFLEKQVSQDQRKELEYVDLRIEKKIYYKMKKKEGEDDKDEEDDKDKEDDKDEDNDINSPKS
jgi:cell division septal protein FtsQ